MSLKQTGLSVLLIFYWIPAIVILLIYTYRIIYYLKIEKKKVSTQRHQTTESLLMGWITLTNMENNEKAARYRLFTSVYITIVNSFGLISCMILVNLEYVEELNALPLVQDKGTFQILIFATVLLGVMSWTIDIITAGLKLYFNDTKDFYEGSVLLEGLKYMDYCC